MAERPSFDPSWEEGYSRGEQINRYPWDMAVTFVFQNAPRDRPRKSVALLEVGFGTGSNLWFAAREGFSVAGVEGSATAVEHARERLAEEGLAGDLRVGDFASLPFEDQCFDLVLDRGALTCVGHSIGAKAVAEARRVLRTGGRFLWNPYSDRHSSSGAGRRAEDGLTLDITGGSLAGQEWLGFWPREAVDAVISDGWTVLKAQHLEIVDEQATEFPVHAEWRLLLERSG